MFQVRAPFYKYICGSRKLPHPTLVLFLAVAVASLQLTSSVLLQQKRKKKGGFWPGMWRAYWGRKTNRVRKRDSGVQRIKTEIAIFVLLGNLQRWLFFESEAYFNTLCTQNVERVDILLRVCFFVIINVFQNCNIVWWNFSLLVVIDSCSLGDAGRFWNQERVDNDRKDVNNCCVYSVCVNSVGHCSNYAVPVFTCSVSCRHIMFLKYLLF